MLRVQHAALPTGRQLVQALARIAIVATDASAPPTANLGTEVYDYPSV
jgi:hypothetical protein